MQQRHCDGGSVSHGLHAGALSATPETSVLPRSQARGRGRHSCKPEPTVRPLRVPRCAHCALGVRGCSGPHGRSPGSGDIFSLPSVLVTQWRGAGQEFCGRSLCTPLSGDFPAAGGGGCLPPARVPPGAPRPGRCLPSAAHPSSCCRAPPSLPQRVLLPSTLPLPGVPSCQLPPGHLPGPSVRGCWARVGAPQPRPTRRPVSRPHGLLQTSAVPGACLRAPGRQQGHRDARA